MLLANSDQIRYYRVADAYYIEIYCTSALILNQFDINQFINFCIDDFNKRNDNAKLYYYEKSL